MKIYKFIHLLFFILYLSTKFVFSQSLEEREYEVKNTIDKESKFLGDTLFVAQIINDIEQSVNNLNTDKILFYFIDRRVKIDERKEKLSDKKKILVNSFTKIDSTNKKLNNNFEKIDFFKSSNKIKNINDSVIVVNVDMQFTWDTSESNADTDLQNNDDITDSKMDKNLNIVNDTWIFEKIYGQWKIVSCDNFMKMLNNLANN